ncbi:MAG: Hsp20 family protein [Elusimicrobiota bacterium]
MTREMQKFCTHFPTLRKHSLGFDHIFDLFDRFERDITEAKYPPYDIYQKDGKTFVEVALAGWNKDDLKIQSHDGILNISGQVDKKEKNDEKEVFYQGISRRAFDLKFSISQHVVINKAEMNDGLLRLELEEVVPEEKKPKLIEIE